MLCYSNGNHYDAVYDVKFQKNAAMCQCKYWNSYSIVEG